MHLNPVRIQGLGLGKADQQRAKLGACPDPGRELVRRRVETLRKYRWSSWRVYAGLESAPGWLETGTIAAGCGGRSRKERRRAMVEYTESPVRQGRLDGPWDRLVGGVILGSEAFAQQFLKLGRAGQTEPAEINRLARAGRMEWPELVQRAEKVLGSAMDKDAGGAAGLGP